MKLLEMFKQLTNEEKEELINWIIEEIKKKKGVDMEPKIEIEVLISNYEEIIKKLETIKKLLNDIKNINIEVE